MPNMACSNHDRGQSDCTDCRALWNRYDKRRKAAIAAGTWQPSIPAATVWAHIERLTETGMTLKAIAAAAQVGRGTVGRIKTGVYVHGPTAAAILAVQPDPSSALWRFGMPVRPVALRVQALAALGWPIVEQADRSGLSVKLLINISNLRQERVSPETRRKVCDLFERLCCTAGPSNQTKIRALKRGWLPPVDAHDTAEWFDEPVEPDYGVDEIAVDRALAGLQVELNDAELIAAVQVGTLKRGMPVSEVAGLLSLRFDHAKLLQAGQLPPARAKRAARKLVAA